ncbi:DUF551 domain-containing protein [Escherichia coli]|uniref:DUF551 domain-containing protein n=1 Tax=Escherichia coli TaxID=562 RepID=UPI0007EBC313|nr:DUF551 domain-containing protein [Escherichia coli]MBJ2009166.1 DUF551 domain-containing protein [Escherichia coli]HBK1615113.1 DUF551 domain-containing protein [Escherichia coli]HCP8500007.1 DUF551 domain-containing protein [Escherichia coli]HDI8409518.1 DUF551 domain-containing protein [Escherichia coli]HDI9950032.1 DUF551 domain-containing protein [Escherichia coli]
MAELTKEWLKQTIAEYEANRDELPFGLDTNSAIELQAFKLELASLEVKPVAYIFKHPAGKLFWALTDESNKEQADVIPVYAAPPVPVVPAALPENDDEDGNDIDYLEPSEVYALGRTAGWNACRAAMLQSQGNCIKDGWISCSERMPEKGQNVLISVNFDSSLVEPLICSARYTGSTFRRGDATIKPGNGIEQATHWMPLPEPPQEVNRG